jgi:SAM-dependent methyltransferase
MGHIEVALRVDYGQVSPAIREHLHELRIVHDPDHPDRQIPPFDAAGRDILDIGCGIGQTLTAPEFAGARSHHGVDVNAEAVDYGMERFPHLSLRHALAEALPYDDETFDLVYSRVAIPYTDIPRALAEARRVLRPGGQLWISLHGWRMELTSIREARTIKKWLFRFYVWANSLWFHIAGRTFKHPVHKRTTCLQTRGGITRALKRAGFDGVELDEQGPHFSARASRP